MCAQRREAPGAKGGDAATISGVREDLFVKIALYQVPWSEMVGSEESYRRSVRVEKRAGAKALRRQGCWHAAGTAGRLGSWSRLSEGQWCKVN